MKKIVIKGMIISVFILSCFCLSGCQKQSEANSDFKLDFLEKEEQTGGDRKENGNDGISDTVSVPSTEEDEFEKIIEEMAVPEIGKQLTDSYKQNNYFYTGSEFDDTYDINSINVSDIERYLSVGDYNGILLRKAGEDLVPNQWEVDERVDEFMNDYNINSYPTNDFIMEGTVVKLHSRTSVDGKVVKEDTDLYLIGGNELPGSVETEMLGKKAGDTFVTNNSFPEDYSDKTLAGKTMMIEGIIDEVRRLYPFTPEGMLLMTNGKYEELNDYSEYLHEMVRKEKDERNVLVYLKDIFSVLSRMTEIKLIPEELKEADRNLYKTLYPNRDDEFYEKAADMLARRELISLYILNKEGAELTQEDISEEFELVRFKNHIHTETQWKKLLEANGNKEEIVKNLLMKKAARIVLEKANLIDLS